MNKKHTTKSLVDPVTLGKIGTAYGIRGWLKIFSSTEDTDNIFNYQPWFIQHAFKCWQIELEDWKHCNHDIIIKIKNIDDRNAAKQLAHCKILVESSQLPTLEEGNYYWKDLIGCKVVTVDGYEIGKVFDLMETGSNDVLIVQENLKDTFDVKERLIPFLYKQVIKKIDFNNGIIKIAWDPSF